jgi:hypothetical protein
LPEAYEAIPSVRRQTRGLLSLDPQEEQGMGQAAIEMLASFIPGVGQLLAGRDIERARRAGDPAAAAMAATEFLPFGRLAGMMRRPGPIMSEIDVYHGSPHRFEEFDASKIGTGEGAQAYGHGIYLAESPAVAEGYRRDLSDKISVNDTVLVDKNRVIGSTGDQAIDDYLLAHRGNLDEAIKDLQEEINRAKAGYPHAVPLYEEEMQKLKALRGRVKVEQGGSLYTADLPDEMVDRMLDYDKPLKDQPAAYKAIRSTIPADVVEDFDANVERGITGGNAYQNWVWGGKTPAGRSEKLRELGIPGIKYSDAGSRGQGGSGTRNFVVFPGEEKKVKILKRE